MLFSGFYCDICGISMEKRATTSESIPSKTYLVKFAREKGWSMGKQILCPECIRKQNNIKKIVHRRGK